MLENVEVIIHSCIRIEGHDPAVVAYFDPYLLDTDPHDADVVFITHDHYDHFSPDDIARVRKEGTVFVVPLSMADKLSELVPPVKGLVALAPGDGITVCGMRVEAVAAYNVGKDFHPQANNWLGYVVTVDGTRYYVAGDTDANDDNRSVSCDVALVPAGGTYTMDAAEAAAFVNGLSPKAAIPTHYGSAVGPKEAGRAFASAVDPSIEVELKLG